MKTVVKYVLLFVCFGLGAAFAIGTLTALMHPNPYGGDLPWFTGMVAAILLLAAFLVFRRTSATKDKSRVTRAPNDAETTHRLQRSMTEFIKIICDDNNPSEVQASAYALTSAAGFLVGFASAKIGGSFEQFKNRCRDGFEKSAQQSYREHSR